MGTKRAACCAVSIYEVVIMEKPIVVRDSKFLLGFSVITMIFFTFALVCSILWSIEKQNMEDLMFCTASFGSLTFLCFLLFLYFFRRKLVLYESYASYTPTIGKTRNFRYSEIQSVVSKREKFIVYSYYGEKLAVFENNMPAAPIALNFLMAKYVKIVPGESVFLDF